MVCHKCNTDFYYLGENRKKEEKKKENVVVM
jgi:hypothetical protein